MVDAETFEKLVDEIAVPSGFVETSTQLMPGEPTILEPWQRYVVDTEDPRVWINKSRQVGFSFALAARGIARCYLEPANSYTLIMVSYNLSDAEEKIRYVNILDESIPAADRLARKKGGDSKTNVEFVNGNRIVTMFLPRGKGNVEVALDEVVFMKDPRRVYQAAIGATSRSGRILGGSSPMLNVGQFADVWNGEGGKFKNYRRLALPWWKSRALCLDVEGAAAMYARGVPMEVLVGEFGRENVVEAYDSLFNEDFATEFCCSWSDSSAAFLSWPLIARVCSIVDAFDDGSPNPRAVRRGLGFLEGVRVLDYVRSLDLPTYAGYDVGRKKDKSEIMLGVLEGERVREVGHVTLDRTEFKMQKKFIDKTAEIGRLEKCLIDENGLGMDLAEYAATEYGSRFAGQSINVKTKPQIANNLRIAMEAGSVEFGHNRETMLQLHSVKRVVRPGSNTVSYDVDRNEKHHADRFFAAGLMLFGASGRLEEDRPQIYVFDFAKARGQKTVEEAVAEARRNSPLVKLERELLN